MADLRLRAFGEASDEPAALPHGTEVALRTAKRLGERNLPVGTVGRVMKTHADGAAVPLSPLRQAGGKLAHAWMVRGDLDPAAVKSNTFTLEWPPRSGQRREFPEVDRAAWFTLDEARRRILKSQAPFLDEVERLVARSAGVEPR